MGILARLLPYILKFGLPILVSGYLTVKVWGFFAELGELRSENATQAETIAELNDALAEARSDLETARKRHKRQLQSIRDLQDEINQHRAERDEQVAPLDDSRLEPLFEAKPGLILRRMNDATSERFAEIEELSELQ